MCREAHAHPWQRERADVDFNGMTLEEWMKAEEGSKYASMQAYYNAMVKRNVGGQPKWGGQLELWAFVILYELPVWVWVPTQEPNIFRLVHPWQPPTSGEWRGRCACT